MRKLTFIFCLATLSLWIDPSFASCTKEEILKLLDRGFDKTQIEKICGSVAPPSPPRSKGDSGGKSTITKLQVKFQDHIIDYDGVIEFEGKIAKLRVKLYDQETAELIKEETRDLELVLLPQGKAFHTRFLIPSDSITPGPHYHEINLIFKKDDEGSFSLQNCNPEECYPGEVKIVKEDNGGDSNQPSLNGAFQMEYTAGTYVHQALLIMNGSSGKMRVQFFNPDTEEPDLVEMEMQLKRTPKGDTIKGSEPIDVKTGKRHPSYSADNFVFKRYPNGELKVFNVDDNQVTVEVEMQAIETKDELKEAMKKFKWQLEEVPELEKPSR